MKTLVTKDGLAVVFIHLYEHDSQQDYYSERTDLTEELLNGLLDEYNKLDTDAMFTPGADPIFRDDFLAKHGIHAIKHDFKIPLMSEKAYSYYNQRFDEEIKTSSENY